MSRKNIITISTIAIILILGGVFLYRSLFTNHDLQYSQEYIAGSGNIKGNVDTQSFLDKGKEFAIGANRYGYAVFKDPGAAFHKLNDEYHWGIALIREEFNLSPLSKTNYEWYKIYGWQVTTGTEEEKEQARFITSFFDIYENSFHEQ
jgi:hypothetical protein